MKSFSVEAKMTLRNNAAFKVAVAKTDSYDMYKIAKSTFSCSTSFGVASHQFKQLFQIKQTGTFTQYKDTMLQHNNTILALFDPTNTGKVDLNDIFIIAFLNGVSATAFDYPINKIYSETVAGLIPNYQDVVTALTSYDLQKRSVDDAPVVIPPGPAILASVAPAQPICTECKKPFAQVISMISGRSFALCYNCNKKKKEAAAPPVPATPQQLQRMQANVVKAQATLLAAQSGYKLPAQPLPPPTLPPPTTDQQQANYMNQYVQSPSFLNYQSYTATSRHHPTDTCHLDSGASMICT